MEPIEYFISYAHRSGFGNISLSLPYPITNEKTISEIQNFLTKEYGILDPCVLNWRKYEGQE
jgi:hypothetical protein